MKLRCVFVVYNDVLYPVPARIGLPVPERRLGSKLPKLDSPLSWIKVPSREEERNQDPSEGRMLATRAHWTPVRGDTVGLILLICSSLVITKSFGSKDPL